MHTHFIKFPPMKSHFCHCSLHQRKCEKQMHHFVVHLGFMWETFFRILRPLKRLAGFCLLFVYNLFYAVSAILCCTCICVVKCEKCSASSEASELLLIVRLDSCDTWKIKKLLIPMRRWRSGDTCRVIAVTLFLYQTWRCKFQQFVYRNCQQSFQSKLSHPLFLIIFSKSSNIWC